MKAGIQKVSAYISNVALNRYLLVLVLYFWKHCHYVFFHCQMMKASVLFSVLSTLLYQMSYLMLLYCMWRYICFANPQEWCNASWSFALYSYQNSGLRLALVLYEYCPNLSLCSHSSQQPQTQWVPNMAWWATTVHGSTFQSPSHRPQRWCRPT